MPLDPEKVAECRAWLDRAWADIESASLLLTGERARPDTALFTVSKLSKRRGRHSSSGTTCHFARRTTSASLARRARGSIGRSPRSRSMLKT